MLRAPVLARVLPICVRTVEISTPCRSAISFGLMPLQSASSTRVSAAVKPWARAKPCTESRSQT
jgi:hypothetical protein